MNPDCPAATLADTLTWSTLMLTLAPGTAAPAAATGATERATEGASEREDEAAGANERATEGADERATEATAAAPVPVKSWGPEKSSHVLSLQKGLQLCEERACHEIHRRREATEDRRPRLDTGGRTAEAATNN